MTTKEKILDTAQALFAEHGPEKASLRLISSEAGVNVAAVNYHFGSKENLLREIFVRLMVPLDMESERILAEARKRAKGAPMTVRDLVRAFLAPWFAFKARHPEYIVIFAQFYAKQEKNGAIPFQDLIREKARQAYTTFADGVRQALPEVTEKEVSMRINMAVAAAASVLVNFWLMESLADLSGTRITDQDLFEHCAGLVEFGITKGE